jgi:hypothetical protein
MYCIKQDLILFRVTGINALNVGFYFTEEVLDPSVPKVMDYMIKPEAINITLQLTLHYIPVTQSAVGATSVKPYGILELEWLEGTLLNLNVLWATGSIAKAKQAMYITWWHITTLRRSHFQLQIKVDGKYVMDAGHYTILTHNRKQVNVFPLGGNIPISLVQTHFACWYQTTKSHDYSRNLEDPEIDI